MKNIKNKNKIKCKFNLQKRQRSDLNLIENHIRESYQKSERVKI
jgi:hypothetical protein